MKVYTGVEEFNGVLCLGTVLVGDKDEIYSMSYNTLETKDIDTAHLLGLQRAIAFVKGNNPLNTKEDITYYPTKHYHKPYNTSILREKISNNVMIQSFLNDRGLNLKYNTAELTDFDKQINLSVIHQLRCAKQTVQFNNLSSNRTR